VTLSLIGWDAPGPYHVAFSTRVGGVSDGPFSSLNLGRHPARPAEHRDLPENVEENRLRLAGAVGADAERLSFNKQIHSATVHRAGGRGEPGDGLWTDEPGVPMLKLVADCVPVAIARANGGTPALALLHAGWRGLLEGIVAAGAAALGSGRLAAIVGPSIGPCCYDVGPEVAEPFAARFGSDVLRGRNLDLWTSAERALREAGASEIERVDLCTSCHPDLFFSYRRDGAVTGAQGVIGYLE
jgi:YfiH family protein